MAVAVSNIRARGGQLLDQRMMRRQMADRIGDALVNFGSSLPTGSSGYGFTEFGRSSSTPWRWSNQQPSSSGIVKASGSTGDGNHTVWDEPMMGTDIRVPESSLP